MKLTAEMIREAEAHLPSSRNKLPEDRWTWMADFLNATLSDPGKICPCCRTTRDGEIMDHLPAPKPPSVTEALDALDRLYRWSCAMMGCRVVYTGDHPIAVAERILAAPKPGEEDVT